MGWKTSIKSGIYLGLAVALGTQILTWLGLGLTNWFVALTYLLVVLAVILNSRSLKRQDGGVLTFPRALLSVFIIVLIGRIIFQLYMFFYTRYIEPEWVDQVAVIWTQMMQESGTAGEVIDRQIAGFRRAYETLPMFTVELVKYGVSQFLLGLLVSLFFVIKIRRKKG